jgi:hypothetical protein
MTEEELRSELAILLFQAGRALPEPARLSVQVLAAIQAAGLPGL